jgi:hypothetical protein
MKIRHLIDRPLYLLIFSLGAAPALLSANPVVELDAAQAGSVPASILLPAEVIKADSYQVAPSAEVYSSIVLFSMDTEFGQATLVGRQGVMDRVVELHAITQLEAMKGSEVYKASLKSSAGKPVQAVKNLVDSPKETLSAMGRGIGGFFADVGYSMVSDDPNQESVTKTAVGFAVAKRQLAFKLGVSPYSTFQPLQDELSDVAWAAVGGGMTVSVFFKAFEGAGTALSVSGTAESMRGLVRDHSPRELQNMNFDRLLAMGVEEPLAEVMLNNFNYDPENETRLIGALNSMQGVAGRELFIRRAALQDKPYNARLMREWAELFADYHANVQKVKAIAISQTAPQLVLEGDKVVALVPADYLTNSPGFQQRNAANIASLRAMGLTPDEAWVTGKIDPSVRQMLLDSGWTRLVEDADTLLVAKN